MNKEGADLSAFSSQEHQVSSTLGDAQQRTVEKGGDDNSIGGILLHSHPQVVSEGTRRPWQIDREKFRK